MRDGYILLHRQGITPEEWKTPERTLAWIDLLTLTNFENGIITVSYGFLATRWRVGKSTVYKWMRHWIGERQIERTGERDSERNGERFFIVNYAKYQKLGERVSERKGERRSERKGELRYKITRSKSVVLNKKNTVDDSFFSDLKKYLQQWDEIGNPEAYIRKIRKIATDYAIKKAWREWKRGVGIETPAQFYARCVHWNKHLA